MSRCIVEYEHKLFTSVIKGKISNDILKHKKKIFVGTLLLTRRVIKNHGYTTSVPK